MEDPSHFQLMINRIIDSVQHNEDVPNQMVKAVAKGVGYFPDSATLHRMERRSHDIERLTNPGRINFLSIALLDA